MNRPLSRSLSFLAVAAIAATTVACGDDVLPSNENMPFRGEWTAPVTANFNFEDPADGSALISSFYVGLKGDAQGDNLANRGDIVVEFDDALTNTIEISMRPFAYEKTEAAAKTTMSRLSLLLSDEAASSIKVPTMPNLSDASCLSNWTGSCQAQPSGNCLTDFTDGCRVGVYYAAQKQPERSGADLKVRVPGAYRRKVTVITDDMLAPNYSARGDVCVSNFRGTTDVTVGDGRVYMVAADDLSPFPTCPQAEIDNCVANNYDSTLCKCQYASTTVASREGYGANITVDVPAGLWVGANLTNNEPNAAELANCALDVSGVADWTDQVAKSDKAVRGAANLPKDGAGMPNEALLGLGYQVTGDSKLCASVNVTDDPSAYVSEEDGGVERIAVRGNVTLCEGCVRSTGKSCADLLAQVE